MRDEITKKVIAIGGVLCADWFACSHAIPQQDHSAGHHRHAPTSWCDGVYDTYDKWGKLL